jgi:predicted nucleotidyltransferase
MQKIDQALMDAYQHFRERGVISVYRWGSSIRNDYRPGISDYDNLVIVEDVPNLPTESEFKEYVDKKYPDLLRFHVNYLAIDEIEGTPPHNKLIKLFPVEYLLDQFNTWKYVCGKKLSIEDFKVTRWTTDEIIQDHKKIASYQFKEIESKYSTGLHYLPVKSCIVLCYHLHRKAKGNHEYNYLTILDNMTDDTKNILPLLMEIRSKQYPVDEVRKAIPKITHWFESI